MSYSTEQEAFWAGEFGDAYVARSQGAALVAGRTNLWARALARAGGTVSSAVELGANIGLNMRALRHLLPSADLTAVEINPNAAEALRALGDVTVIEGSLLDTGPQTPADLAFTCGVLIHIAPERLADAYDRLAAASRRWVVISEYYDPNPTSLPYRGHEERLFKRDFAGEFMARHPDYALRDYGFIYHGDPNFAVDDLTWFLMERAPAA